MSNDPRLNVEQELNAAKKDRAVREAAVYVKDTIKPFTDAERKALLDLALAELGSGLVVIVDRR